MEKLPVKAVGVPDGIAADIVVCAVTEKPIYPEKSEGVAVCKIISVPIPVVVSVSAKFVTGVPPDVFVLMLVVEPAI